MMTTRVRSLIVLAGISFSASVVPAQQMAAAHVSESRAPRLVPDTEIAQDVQAVLATPVTLSLSNVTLETALREIVRVSGVRIAYTPAVVPVTRRVSLAAHKTELGEALRQILHSTGAIAQVSPSGRVMIVAGEAEGKAARAEGVIVGKVVNARTKSPIAGATVMDDSGQSITTGADGTFRMTGAVGERVLRVRAVGFTRQERRVTIRKDESVSVEVVMEPSASVLDEVIVTGTVVATARKEIPTPITVISGEDLEKRGITRIEQLFRGEVPGLLVLERGAAVYSNQTVGQGVSSTIYSRGSADLTGGANPIKTYVDGVELLDPAYLGTIDPRSIEKIEIVTGPQAATIYGSGAMGGVMQIFTKKGSRNSTPDIQLSVKYGILQNNFSQGKTPEHHDVLTMTGGSGPEFSYSGNLSYDYTGQWQPKLFARRVGASLGATHTRGPLSTTASFSTSSSRNGTWRYGFSDGYAFQHVDLTGCSAESYCSEDISAKFYSDQISTSSNQTMSLNADYRMTSTWQHHATIGRSQNIMALKPVAPNFADAQVGADTLFQVKRLSGQRTSWNYNTSYLATLQWISSSVTLGASGSTGDQLSVNGSQASKTSSTIIGWRADQAPSVNLPLNDKSWGAFGQAQIGLFKQLYASFGLRFEQNPDYGQEVKWDITPTHGLAYTIEYGELSLKLLGSYGRATRPPAADQRMEKSYIDPNADPSFIVYQFANSELRPEYSRGPQGGLELYYGNRVALTVNHYSQTVTDLIQGVPADSIYLTYHSWGYEYWAVQIQNRNIAKIRQMGWEGTGSVTFGPITAKGTYSWSDSRVLSVHPRGGSSYRPGETFRYVPTHTGYVSLSYAQGPTSITIANNYVGSRSERYGDDRMYYDVYLGRHSMYGIMASSRRGNFRNAISSLPGYNKSDIAASHRLTPQLTFTMNVVNLGNSFASDLNDLNPSLGRQTTLGFSYRF